jgi:hypothetical protein
MNNHTIGLEDRQYAARRVEPAAPHADARSFLLRSTQKVIDHYRRLLSTHSMSATEKHAILLRLEKHEGLLRDLEGVDQPPGRSRHIGKPPRQLDVGHP